VGSLKLLQDLHNTNKISQTRLRFVVCLFLANFSPLMNVRRMVCWIYETDWSSFSVWEEVLCVLEGGIEKNGWECTQKRPALMWNTEAAIRTG
jgi:hypothetical protein